MKIQVEVIFRGSVIVDVPRKALGTEALAERFVLAKLLATNDNSDAPEETALEDYCDEVGPLSERDAILAEDFWDRTKIIDICGTWAIEKKGKRS